MNDYTKEVHDRLKDICKRLDNFPDHSKYLKYYWKDIDDCYGGFTNLYSPKRGFFKKRFKIFHGIDSPCKTRLYNILENKALYKKELLEAMDEALSFLTEREQEASKKAMDLRVKLDGEAETAAYLIKKSNEES